jgi:hypothetical protein
MRAILLAFTLAIAATTEAQLKNPWKQPHGLVPDKESAIKIAEAVLFPIYGESQIKSERPYEVALLDGFWHIKGSLTPPPSGECMFGGTFYITISQWDGRVIEIGHEE